MFRFVLLACAIALMAETIQAAAIPEELADAAKTAHEVCVKETGVTEEMVEKAANGDMADDEKLKCYLKCAYQQFGLLEKGDIDWDMMLAIVPDSIKEGGTKAVQTCRAKITGGKDNLCQKVYDIQKCWLEVAPEIFFVV